jgi:acyl-CoA thioesterase
MRDPDDLARTVAEAMLSHEGTGPALGVELEAAREGYARAAMTIRPDMLNGHGTAHGGMIFALADSAFAYACNSRNQTTVAQHASISFLSPVRAGERLTAEAQERALDGRSGVYDVVVRSGEKVVAVFQGLSRAVGGPVVEAD